MRKLISLTASVALAVTLVPSATGAPTAAQVQKQVNELREEAAGKYEAANGIKYQISKLQR